MSRSSVRTCRDIIDDYAHDDFVKCSVSSTAGESGDEGTFETVTVLLYYPVGYLSFRISSSEYYGILWKEVIFFENAYLLRLFVTHLLYTRICLGEILRATFLFLTLTFSTQMMFSPKEVNCSTLCNGKQSSITFCNILFKYLQIN